ncbi:MAG: hypothetical protein M9938_09205 [Solirubrobacterales bacterium]|nr:hypothetical protein [Solirubrobacterales bacterium]
MSTKGPRRGTAGRSQTGRSCPHCKFPIKERDEIATCGVCGTTHHQDCWEDAGGCAVEGCAGAKGAETTDRAVPSRAGSTVPPKAGPSAKKQKIEPAPPRRPRRRIAPEPDRARTAPPPAEPVARVDRSPWWIAVGVAAFCALIGILIVSNTFGDGNPKDEVKCEQGTGKDGVPCYDNGRLPNIPRAEMAREVQNFMQDWFSDVRGFDAGTIWENLSERKRTQIREAGGDRYSFWNNYRSLAKHLDPSGLRATLKQPDYPEEGVVTVYLGEMPYNDPRDLCQSRGGITWAKWDPTRQRWTYEPGVDVTPQRLKDWGGQGDQLFRPGCK